MGISREQRIKLRAEEYAKGKIDLDTFILLERLDDTPEVAPIEEKEAATTEAIQAKAASTAKKESRAPQPPKRKPGITLEEFNKLTIDKQQKLYDEFPNEVTALINTK